MKLLSLHLEDQMDTEELRTRLSSARSRFGVPPNDTASETWENNSLQRAP